MTYVLEHSQNRMMIEKLMGEIADLRVIDSSVPPEGEKVDGMHVQIKEKALRVVEALSAEFKIFKAMSNNADPHLWRLIAYYCIMDRTFEVTKITEEVSTTILL
jgi:hypothetical protein